MIIIIEQSAYLALFKEIIHEKFFLKYWIQIVFYRFGSAELLFYSVLLNWVRKEGFKFINQV